MKVSPHAARAGPRNTLADDRPDTFAEALAKIIVGKGWTVTDALGRRVMTADVAAILIEAVLRSK